jgi:uncharacterized repeat protein (TIGR01451 family)
MFRSIRAAKAKSRRAKSIANSRQLLLESLEQRRLLSASPGLTLTPINVTSPAAIYGPVQGGVGEPAGINLRAEGEGESTPDTARQLLFAGIAGSTASPTNSGLLTIIDATPDSPTDTIVPWKAPVLSGGIAGLAFDLSGHLYAAVDQGPCTPSELVELNPADGTVIRRLPILAGATAINIGDLAIEPATGRLFGTRSIRDDANHAGELFIIDVASGAATFVGDTGTRTGEGLAFAADGTLYLAGTAGGKPVLYKIDPATAEPHQRDPLTGRAIPFVVLNDPSGQLKEIEGLVGHPDNGTLIATTSMTRPAATQIVDDTYVIDLSTGKVTARALASPARGIFGDLAFQPSPHALDIVYQENFEAGIGGFVTDNTGGTLPGLWHSSLGRRFDKLPSHTPISSFYYGAFETAFGDGHYVLPLDHEGTLTSPQTKILPTSSVLSFNYLLDTRPELDVDFVTVSVITEDGNITQILSRADGTLPQTGRQNWRTATADLSAFACQRIQLQFSFDTGAAPIIDPEGWYLDDLMIGSTGGICDFGDAPDDPANPNDYPTLLASNGARHGVVDGFHLGKTIDDEPDGQPTAMADGDDKAGLPDEDGVAFVTAIVPAEEAKVEVVASGTGLLSAWIDFNGNGRWDDVNEMVFKDVPLSDETKELTFTVPVKAVPTERAFARFRFSTQADLYYAGFAVDGEVEDHTLKIDVPAPSIKLDKRFFSNADEDGSGTVTLNDTLTYHFEVINDGNQTLRDVVVSDLLPGLSAIVPSQFAQLSPGSTTTFTATYVVRQSDMDDPDMEINNTAAVTGTDPQGDTQTGTDREAVMVPYDPIIAIDKFLLSNADEDNSGTVTRGDTLTYNFKVTNTGPQTLSNVMVSDPLVGLSTVSPSVVATLAPKAMATFSATYVVRQSDMDDPDMHINNTATVTATAPKSDTVMHTDSEAVMVQYDPKVAIDKFLLSNLDEDNSGTVTRGDTLTYNFKVTNRGLQTLSNVMVSDPLVGLSAVSPSVVATLAPKAIATFSATYKVRQSDMDDPDMEINNTATVTATAPKSDTVMHTDSEAVMVQYDPKVAIDKFLLSNLDEDNSGTVTRGDTLTYNFKVTNRGPQTLSNVMVSDPLVGLNAVSPSVVATLAPKAIATFSATYKVRQSDMDDPDMEINNTATVTATDPKNKPQSGMDSEAVMVDIDPSIEIDKFLFNKADEDRSGTVTLGDTLTYHFKVTNSGLQTLTNVSVSDPLPGLSPITPSGVPRLAPGETATFSATYKVRQSDATSGKIINTATATGTDSKGMLQMDFDMEMVPVLPLTAPQIVQFITPMSWFRPDGPSPFETLDPNEEIAISGYKWNDLDQDGVWDANESGRAGWSIYIDLNGDNIFNPVTEPLAITDSTGRYVFTAAALANVPSGTYAIRDDRLVVSAGTFQIQKFPAPAPGVRDPDEHLFNWSPGMVLQGRPRVAEAPNFGVFDYSPFIRPADDQLGHLSRLSSADKVQYLAALAPWQSIEVSNTTSSDFNVVGIDTSRIATPGNGFVTLVDDKGDVIGQNHVVLVPNGETRTVYVFYDPAIRQGDTVTKQYPDWLNGAGEVYGPHTFTREDQLTIVTDPPTLSFPVKLVGGSTYDSDIFYDGAVDRLDLRRLEVDLLDENEHLPIVDGASRLFDVTSDINARCPNGAEGILNTCAWNLFGNPAREIALGDFGTLNTEFDRARAPFLDLDTDNSSGALGTGYAAEFVSGQIPVVDIDASFANSGERLLLTVIVTAPLGDILMIPKGTQPNTITVTSEMGGSQLVLSGKTEVSSAANVANFMTALSLIRYQAKDPSIARVAEIKFVATGLPININDPDYKLLRPQDPTYKFTVLTDESGVEGNTAFARIKVIGSQ